MFDILFSDFKAYKQVWIYKYQFGMSMVNKLGGKKSWEKLAAAAETPLINK